MEGVTLSHWMIGSEETDGVPEGNVQEFGGRGVGELLKNLFRSATDSGAVLTGQEMSAALAHWDIQSHSDIQGGKANPPQTVWSADRGDADPGFDSRDLPSASSTEPAGTDPELSAPWVVHFMRTAKGLSAESLTLLFQACEHLERSERAE